MGKPIAIIAGVGNATGSGASSAREFSRDHRIAVIGRRVAKQLIEEIEQHGGEALACNIKDYTHDELKRVFAVVREKWPDSQLDIAVWNASFWWCQPFLDTSEETIKASCQINIVSAFAFAQEAIRWFLEKPEQIRHRGTLLVTGATSATRGAAMFSAFAAGKHGSRAMVQSIAREFGPRGVHACFCILDGVVKTDATTRNFGSRSDKDEGWLDDRMQSMSPDSVAKAYRWLHEQSTDAWTAELDLRPAKEHF